MADPYATEAPDLSGRPTGPPPWAAAVGERGGEFVDERGGEQLDGDESEQDDVRDSRSAGGADGPGVDTGRERDGESVDGSGADAVRFRVVACRGLGVLAPFARLDPAMAVLLWLEHNEGERSAAVANRLLAELQRSSLPLFAIKQGMVAGPVERPGCFVIDEGFVLTVLDAALAGGVRWECDPDFGYEVPSEVAGVTGKAARAVLPRLLYADHDRAYEHAGLVATRKRERAAIAAALSGLDPAIAAAAGWPPVPTGDEWRD